jgi:hypothetical protein
MLRAIQCKHRNFVTPPINTSLEFCGYKAYTTDNTLLGSIYDFVCDQHGNIIFLVVEAGFWVFAKKVLVPLHCFQFIHEKEKALLPGFTPEVIQRLPAFHSEDVENQDYLQQLYETYELLGIPAS